MLHIVNCVILVSFTFLGSCPSELDRHAASEPTPEQTVLTVVIPVFNGEQAIKGTLHPVINVLREFGWQYEVIVVNDGSTDRTASLLRHALARGDVRIIEHPSNTGCGAALKTGARYASFPWIAIVDADGTYPLENRRSLEEPTWCRRHAPEATEVPAVLPVAWSGLQEHE